MVDRYKKIIKEEKTDVGNYNQFFFANLSNAPLIIRRNRKSIRRIANDLSSIKGPSFIFYNAVLPDEKIPEDIKKKYNKDIRYVPAYFDDSGKILELTFVWDGFGIGVTNILENLIKDKYASLNGEIGKRIILYTIN